MSARLKYIFPSLFTVASIPLFALAIEPADPVGFCSRFIDSKEQAKCEERSSKENIDWYAAAICNLQKEDGAFWICWDGAKDKTFNPQALEKCEANAEFTDDERQACVNAASSARRPASNEAAEIFQPLKTKKKK